MNIQSGFYYHIKDTFFEEVQDSSLMANKEDGNYRPHYIAVQDSQNPGIYWMVPVSSKFEKYQNIYNRQVARYNLRLHKCGIPLFYTDIDRIYHMMEEKWKTGN